MCMRSAQKTKTYVIEAFKGHQVMLKAQSDEDEQESQAFSTNVVADGFKRIETATTTWLNPDDYDLTAVNVINQAICKASVLLALNHAYDNEEQSDLVHVRVQKSQSSRRRTSRRTA